MEKKMEATVMCGVLYWDNGKANGKYYSTLGMYILC